MVGHEDDRPLDARDRDVETDAGCTWDRKSGSSPAFCATSRAAMAGRRRDQSVRNTVERCGGTHASADRGTCGRRPLPL